MQWKWNPSFRSLKCVWVFVMALIVCFVWFYVSFPCSTKKRKCSTWVQNEILDISLSLGEETDSLWYTNTHINTHTDEVIRMKLFLFLAILRRIWWRETHDSIQNTLKWIQFSSLTYFSSTAFQVGVWTEPCANLSSLLMILFCGQEKEVSQLSSCFWAYSLISIC